MSQVAGMLWRQDDVFALINVGLELSQARLDVYLVALLLSTSSRIHVYDW